MTQTAVDANNAIVQRYWRLKQEEAKKKQSKRDKSAPILDKTVSVHWHQVREAILDEADPSRKDKKFGQARESFKAKNPQEPQKPMTQLEAAGLFGIPPVRLRNIIRANPKSCCPFPVKKEGASVSKAELPTANEVLDWAERVEELKDWRTRRHRTEKLSSSAVVEAKIDEFEILFSGDVEVWLDSGAVKQVLFRKHLMSREEMKGAVDALRRRGFAEVVTEDGKRTPKFFMPLSQALKLPWGDAPQQKAVEAFYLDGLNRIGAELLAYHLEVHALANEMSAQLIAAETPLNGGIRQRMVKERDHLLDLANRAEEGRRRVKSAYLDYQLPQSPSRKRIPF